MNLEKGESVGKLEEEQKFLVKGGGERSDESAAARDIAAGKGK